MERRSDLVRQRRPFAPHTLRRSHIPQTLTGYTQAVYTAGLSEGKAWVKGYCVANVSVWGSGYGQERAHATPEMQLGRRRELSCTRRAWASRYFHVKCGSWRDPMNLLSKALGTTVRPLVMRALLA